MKYIIILLLLSTYSLFSEYSVNRVEIENCHCDNFGSIYINELTKEVVITCDSGKFLILDSSLKNCNLYTIPNETEDIADAINLGDKYYIMARSLAKPSYGRLYITDDLESYNKYNIDDSYPTNLFTFNNTVYGLSISNQGSIINKSNDSTFEFLYQVPYIFWDISTYKNMAISVGITSSGTYAYKSNDLLSWDEFSLQKSYNKLRISKVIGDVLYIAGDNGNIIQLNENLEVTNTYNFGDNIRISDLVTGKKNNTLLVLTIDRANKISSLIELDLITGEKQMIKEFNDGKTAASEFMEFNGTYYFITSNALLYKVDSKTDVTNNQRNNNINISKEIIKKENLITLLNTNMNFKLYDIVGRKIEESNLINDNYLIQIIGNRILIINSF